MTRFRIAFRRAKVATALSHATVLALLLFAWSVRYNTAAAQTVLNLINLDPTNPGSATTSLDLLNSTTALSNGGLFGAALTNMPLQQATNRVNTLGVTGLGAASPVQLGGTTVSINEVASATATGMTSTTISNTNAAVTSGVNQIIGASSLANAPWTGGYGGTNASASASGNQIGVNTINAAAATLASGSMLALSQLPGVTAAGGIAQGGGFNASVINTLLASSTAGEAVVNGGTPANAGLQTAVNTFNTANLQGNGLTIDAQQLADGFNQAQTGIQSINRALATAAATGLGNIDPSVANLVQNATAGVNALTVAGAGLSGAQGVTLSGTQSTAFNALVPGADTAALGTTATTILTNQVTASTLSAGGFMPSQGAENGPGTPWTGFASTVSTGMPAPGSIANQSKLSATAYANPNTDFGFTPTGSEIAGAGQVALSGIGQSISQTNNTLVAGNTAAPQDVTLAATGFTQRTGTVALTVFGSPGLGTGLNGALTYTGAGTSAISGLAQSFANANNVFTVSGAVSGTLTQSADGVNFSGGQLLSPATAPSLVGATLIAPYAGVGNQEGVPMINLGGLTNGVSNGSLGSSNGPYVAVVGGLVQPPMLNNAQAVTGFGLSTVSGITQTASSVTNMMSANGALTTSGSGGAAAGTVTQTLGSIANYGLPTEALNTQSALSQLAGAASVTNAQQSLTLIANGISSGAGISGSIVQNGPGSPAGTLGGPAISSGAPSNYIGAGSFSGFGQGTATLSAIAQSNGISINTIEAAGSLGGAASPAAFSQTSGQAGLPLALGPSTLFQQASNVAMVVSNDGAGGNAAASQLAQSAAIGVNTLAGGTTTSGLIGNATQVSNGEQTSIGNLAVAYAATAPANASGSLSTMQFLGSNPTTGLGVQGVMSGSATLGGVAQAARQTLNTMSLAGASNGTLNQATFSATLQTTGNQTFAQANRGFATVSGSQLLTNAVNTVAGR